MTIALIWAQASNGCLGKDGTLPWHLPEDLLHFRTTTLGGTVVMGRRTYASLPDAVRPLPGRDTVVLTSSALDEPGVRTYTCVEDLLADHVGAGGLRAGREGGDLWVAGGAQVYAALEPHADRAIVTEIDAPYDGDVHAPVLGAAWAPSSVGEWELSASTGLRYRIVEHLRSAA